MTTVASRIFRSTPYRDASDTWDVITSLLTRQDNKKEDKLELQRVTGIAACIIADKAPKDSPIIVTCDGPRIRIYCLYDDDAIEGSDVREDVLGFDPLQGDWAISLPCQTEDLEWVQSMLAKQSNRITARDENTGITVDTSKTTDSIQLQINPDRFLEK